MKKNTVDIFGATTALKILAFLSENPGIEFLGSEIQKAVPVSRAGVYLALRQLTAQGLVRTVTKGKFLMYSVVYDEPQLKQFKIMRTTQYLKPLVEKLKQCSRKVVLYGSASRGEDGPASDIDLFVLANEPDLVPSIIAKMKLKRKIQAVIRSPSEFAESQDVDSVYYEEVKRGISLWEQKE